MSGRPLAVVLRPLGLGDFLTGVPAYRAIRRAFPDHRVVLAAPAALAPLVDLAGGIDELVPTQPLVALDRSLQAADVALDLHGRGPRSHRVMLAARPRRLIAFRHAEIAESAAGPAWFADEHEVLRWCRLLAHAGIAANPRDLDLRVPDEPLTAAVRGATIVHPAAASGARRWPLVRWAAVARAQARAGRRVVITGSAAERERAHAVCRLAGLPPDAVVAGETNLRELAALIAAADRVICGDTGIAHLATAYRIPSVVLFGPIPPAWWGPPPERPYHRALWAGRHGDPHGATVDPGLLEITVSEVCAALETLPERTPALR